MATATATKSRRPQTRTATLRTIGTAQVLGLTTGKDTVFYLLTPLAADRVRGFRLCKADRGDGPGEEYDVLLDGQFSSCECMGFLRHSHCKHVESLTALVASGKIAAPSTDADDEDRYELAELPEEEETIELTEEPPQPAHPLTCPRCGCLESEHISGFCP